MTEGFWKWAWEIQLPQAQIPQEVSWRAHWVMGCVWEGTALSHRQRNQGRSLLQEALLGSLGSSSSYITYAWKNCDAINPNMLPQAHPSLGLQG